MSVPTFEEALRAGIACFQAQEFFEAHEEWEERWLVETGERKRFLHGLIQIAAALVKISIGEWPSAEGLLEHALEKLDDFDDVYETLALEQLRRAASVCLGEVRMLQRGMISGLDPHLIPRIELVEVE
jgi:predicted metal-dependent hydrolase